MGSQAVSFASEFGALKSTEVRHRDRQNEADDKQHDCEFEQGKTRKKTGRRRGTAKRDGSVSADADWPWFSAYRHLVFCFPLVWRGSPLAATLSPYTSRAVKSRPLQPEKSPGAPMKGGNPRQRGALNRPHKG